MIKLKYYIPMIVLALVLVVLAVLNSVLWRQDAPQSPQDSASSISAEMQQGDRFDIDGASTSALEPDAPQSIDQVMPKDESLLKDDVVEIETTQKDVDDMVDTDGLACLVIDQDEIEKTLIPVEIPQDIDRTQSQQDTVMNKWSKDEQISEGLLTELTEEYPLKSLSTEELFDLLLGILDQREIQRTLIGIEVREGIARAQRHQDAMMSKWPRYEHIREQILWELGFEYPLESLSIEELIDKVVELREEFWKDGGNWSMSAWEPGYKSRLLAEIAAEKAPNNHIVIDELVETMHSLMPPWPCDDGYSREEKEAFRESLKDLRQKQFEQLREEIANGRPAELSDFVRGADLIMLVQAVPPNNQYCIEVIQYLKSMCETNEWTKFQEYPMGWIEEVLEIQGYGFGFNIYTPRNNIMEKEYGYGRRLPSFRGPPERNVILLENLTR